MCCGLTSRLAAKDRPAALRPFELQAGDVFVLLGDADVALPQFTQYLETFLLTRFPDRELHVYRSNLRQHYTSPGAPVSLPPEVTTLRPSSIVVVCDMWGENHETVEESRFQAFRQHLTNLDQQIRDLQATPIYLSPRMLDVVDAQRHTGISSADGQELISARLALYANWLQEFATNSAARFVDLHGPMHARARESRLKSPDLSFNSADQTPNSAGQLVMADAFLDQLGLMQPLSSIQFTQNSEGMTIIAEGGSVLNVQSDRLDAISFVWIAEALPWITPPEIASTSEFLELSERYNQETIVMRGLSPGRYEFRIDDRLIGQFSDMEFAAGIALQQFTTPQSVQGRLVMQANLERGQEYLSPANQLARLISKQEELLRELAKMGDTPALIIQRLSATSRLAELRVEKAKLDADAEEVWSHLQELAQPEPRRFQIRPVPKVQVQGRVLVGGMPISGAAVELHGVMGISAAATTDAMGFFELTAQTPDGIPVGDAILVVLAKMVLPEFVSLEKTGHRILLRAGVNEVELHFESLPRGE